MQTSSPRYERRGGRIETYTGRKFWPLDPRPEEVCIEDIAHALSLLCRFNGQCKHFYSVAQHSLLCNELAYKRGMDDRMQLLALLHDASEAYVSDVSRPVKPYLKEFQGIENRVQKVIFEAFSIKEPSDGEKKLIEEIDLILLATEAKILMPFIDWGLPYPPTDKIEIMECTAGYVEEQFKTVFINLSQ